MAQTLLIAVVVFAGFVILFAMDAHGKARAFDQGEVDEPAARRPPEAVTNVELPTPRFNQRDPDYRRREAT